MPNEPVDRRDFARLLAVGGAGAVFGAVNPAVRGDEPPAATTAPKPEPGDDEADRDDEPGPPPPPVLLTLALLARYPHENLTGEILEKVERDVAVGLYRGRRLAKYPFTNADEPAFVFSAYRADG